MKDLLSTIRNVESESDEKLREAKGSSKAKIAAAHEEAKLMIQKGMADIQIEYDKIIKQYEEEGQNRVSSIEQDIQKQCKELTERSIPKLDLAAEKILERIIS